MSKVLRITDYFIAYPVEDDNQTQNKDFFFSFGKPTSRRYRNTSPGEVPDSLTVRIAATHAGKVTLNNGFYFPDKMEAAVPSWTEPFAKPILLHHEKEDDSIGRVVSARYVNYEPELQNYSDSNINESMVQDFLKGSLSDEDLRKVVNSLFLDKGAKYTKDPNYMGLGHIEITARIGDKDAIAKILDQRFLTGSIGATTDKAMCSVCGKDWLKDEQCEHKPGKEYKDKLCVILTGNLQYNEYSYVNSPADVHSQTVEILADGVVQDFKQWITDKQDNVFNVSCGFSIEDSQEEDNSIKDNIVEDNANNTEQDVEDKEVSVESNVEDENKPVEKNDELSLLFGDELVDLLGEEPTDADYEYVQMLADAKLGRLEMSDQEVSDLLDAKLSAKARKGLSSSTFCGPNRSFPVPDCAHVTAARRLVGRYKGPGSKSTILACVNRKAKRMGCDTKDTEDKETHIIIQKIELAEDLFNIESFDAINDEQLTKLFESIQAVMAERELTDNKDQELIEQSDWICALQNDFEQTIDQARTYFAKLLNTSDNNLVTDTASLETIYGIIDNRKTEQLNNVKDKDIKPIEDAVHNSIDENLTDTQDTSNNEYIVTKEMLEEIRNKYMELRFTYNEHVAEKYLEDLKQRGIIPREINDISKK